MSGYGVAQAQAFRLPCREQDEPIARRRELVAGVRRRREHDGLERPRHAPQARPDSLSQLYQWKRPRSRPGTKRSGRGRRLGAPPMMARRHGLQAAAQRTTAVASRRRSISMTRSGGSDAHVSMASILPPRGFGDDPRRDAAGGSTSSILPAWRKNNVLLGNIATIYCEIQKIDWAFYKLEVMQIDIYGIMDVLNKQYNYTMKISTNCNHWRSLAQLYLIIQLCETGLV